jgi:hypothetical protein
VGCIHGIAILYRAIRHRVFSVSQWSPSSRVLLRLPFSLPVSPVFGSGLDQKQFSSRNSPFTLPGNEKKS